ncbi:MAG: DUF4838 domain-containing protein [Bacteroidetes bacterium]|nr:DUF4838 domain-containing protein [Bacteroidota bacterium]
MDYRYLAAFFLFLFQPPLLQAQEITLVSNSKTEYVIIIPRAYKPEERQAAFLLKEYLKKITRAEFPVFTDDHRKEDNEILIGNNNRVSGKYPDVYAPELRPGGFWIKTSGNKLIIMGGEGKGVIYGVTAFLEDHLGYRKYSPDVEKIPRKTTLKIKRIDDIQVPPTTIRIVNGPYFMDENYRDFRKLQNIEDLWGNTAEDRYYVHTFNRLVPPGEYFKDHPEYYSQINGQRVSWGQLCLSNPELVRISVKKLREVMQRHPDIKYWSVSQNDNYYSCECPRCKAIDLAEGSQAGLLLRFVNQVADSFPDKVITTLAYQYTRKPPLITRPARNVMITLCSIELNRSLPIETDSSSQPFIDDLKGWSRICNNIKIWDYEVQFTNYLCPFPLFHTLQPNLRFFNKYNVTAHFQQCNIDKGVEFAELKAYLLSKLLWNPEANADAVIDDFMNGYYEEAGPYIRQYFDLLHGELKKSGDRLDIYGSPVLYENSFLSDDNLKKYEELFEKAELAVAFKPEVLERVKLARLPVQFATMEIAKSDLFGKRGWYQYRNNKYVLKKELNEMLESFHTVCIRNNVPMMNENGLTPEVYYKNTLRSINVQTDGNLAFKKTVTTDPLPDKRYFHQGPSLLTNGVRGTEDYKINWLGWEGLDPKITIDLEQPDSIKTIIVSTLQDPKSWILHPFLITCYLSDDGINFRKAGVAAMGTDQKNQAGVHEFTFRLGRARARYIRFFVTATRLLPDWHPYHGNKSWVFIDEVTVR